MLSALDLNDLLMNNIFLFAIDAISEEIIVSESLRGSNEIKFIERLKRVNNDSLYFAILTLTHLANSSNIDKPIFKAMDKICQSIYLKGKINK